MFGGQKPPLPAAKSQDQFWSHISSLVVFTGVCTLVAMGVRTVERQAANAIINAAN
jgi:hypothetical protein